MTPAEKKLALAKLSEALLELSNLRGVGVARKTIGRVKRLLVDARAAVEESGTSKRVEIIDDGEE